jgi:holo-[acyl-carrier protein] synthase
MIVGLGVDLVEIARIERAMQNPRFARRILTPLELEFCTTPSRVAGRWAAKEAIAKAIGLPITWQDIEILPSDTGSPKATLDPRFFDPGRMRLHVTITHERSNAIAMAVLERLVFQAFVG